MSQEDPISALTDANFEAQVLRAEKPTVVYITSPWNQGSTMMEPTLKTLAKSFSGRVNTFLVNVDDHPMVVAHYEATTLPTLLLFDHGKVYESLEGVLPRPRIQDLYDKAISLREDD